MRELVFLVDLLLPILKSLLLPLTPPVRPLSSLHSGRASLQGSSCFLLLSATNCSQCDDHYPQSNAPNVVDRNENRHQPEATPIIRPVVHPQLTPRP
ncbi:hypothetical protein BDV18DRAFT_146769 [Aspergillus unguis]